MARAGSVFTTRTQERETSFNYYLKHDSATRRRMALIANLNERQLYEESREMSGLDSHGRVL